MTTLHDKTLNRVDHAWLLFLIVTGCAVSALLAASFFDFTVFLSGVLCVGLTSIGRREGHLVGLYTAISYSVLSYSNGLYGEVYLNLILFIPTGNLGYIMWRRHAKEDRTVEMRQLSLGFRVILITGCILATYIVGKLLALNPNQNTPFIDASTNVLSVAATFLAIWRFKEQWLLYIALNAISLFMWILRFQAGGEAGDMMVLTWSLYLATAFFGYWRWHVGIRRDAAAGADPAMPACNAAL